MKTILKSFYIDGIEYVFSSNSGFLVKVDSFTKSIINAINKGEEIAHSNLGEDYDCEGVDFIVDKIISSGFFELNKSLLNTRRTINLRKIILMIAHDCNLSCDYCFGDEGTYHMRGYMTKECAFKSIDFLLLNSKEEKLQVTFFGGEPLLRFDLIREVVEYCKNIEKSSNKKFGFSITTNGTLITKEIEDYFIKENIFVQISIDGNQQMHDNNRHYKSGAGSYNNLVKATKSLISRAKVKGKATIALPNINMVDVFKHICSLGFSQIPITLAHSAIECNDYEQVNYETSRFVNYLFSLIKKGEIDKVKKATRTYKILQMIHYRKYKSTYCGAGFNMVTIDINGKIFPCHRLSADNPESSIGTVYSNDLIENQTNIMNVSEQCSNCWIRGFCGGGCPATNYFFNKTYLYCPEHICKHERHYIEELFKLYIKLSKDEIKLLFNVK